MDGLKQNLQHSIEPGTLDLSSLYRYPEVRLSELGGRYLERVVDHVIVSSICVRRTPVPAYVSPAIERSRNILKDWNQ
jgi:hypothetical protein